ncbi:MAG: hypothetical protein KDB93_07950 [Flavobacteriales bacterium]|nr:hypothetical protein [Flavobacteriales bacterium]
MRKLLFLLLALVAVLPAWACPACQKQQPAILKGITHGTGPQSAWDMPIIIASALIVLVTLVYAVKFLFWPKEAGEQHIKRSILDNTF